MSHKTPLGIKSRWIVQILTTEILTQGMSQYKRTTLKTLRATGRKNTYKVLNKSIKY